MRYQVNIPALGTPQPVLDANAKYAEAERAHREVESWLHNAETHRRAAEEADGQAGAELLEAGGDIADVKTKGVDAFTKKLVQMKALLPAMDKRAEDAYNALIAAMDEHWDEWVDNVYRLLYEASDEYREASAKLLSARDRRDSLLNLTRQLTPDQKGMHHSARRLSFNAGPGNRAPHTELLESTLSADQAVELPLCPQQQQQ